MLYPLLKHVCFFSMKIKGHHAFHHSSYYLALVPARWLLWASEDMLAQKLVTLASTILLLQRILPTQCIYKEAPLAARLHINDSCPFCHTNFIPTTLKSVQEQTQNWRCRSLSILTASKPLIYLTKLMNTLEFKSWDTKESC